MAHADAAWTCSASAGWISGGDAQHLNAPALGGEPCPQARSDATGVTGTPGSLAATGSDIVDGGSASQTTDARQPRAEVQASSLAIRNADGKLALTASNLDVVASASCDSNRNPVYTSSGTPGTVTLNGQTIDTSKDYSGTGTGFNGAPLLGKITIHFNEVTKSDSGITRDAIHLIVTDQHGALVFEAIAGLVSAGGDGSVCAPPPVCPPGTQPQAGKCVDVTVTPPPPPPPPAPPVSPGPVGGGPLPVPSPTPKPHPKTVQGCADADALAGQVSTRRLALATLCLLNVQRRRHHLGTLRASSELNLAAQRHARDMVKRRYFSHTEPDGTGIVQRVLHSGYLSRYGRWRIGENLGWGWGRGASPRAIVIAWMRSPEHRHNILNKGFHDVGIAVAFGSPGTTKSRSITYVIDFGGFDVLH